MIGEIKMKELLSQFWIGVLSCVAFAGLSSFVIYSYGQELLNSIGLGIIIGVIILTIFYMFSKKNSATENYSRINNSQNVNAATISNSQISKIDNIKIDK